MTPHTLHIKKYSNRRLYDQTQGRHLTHAELYDLVARGASVTVTDGATGQDITNVVLAQVLLERDPIKLAAFPPALMHQVIRASEQMLSSFLARYLGQMIDSYGAMQRQIESLVTRGGGAGGAIPSPPVPSAILDWAMGLARPPASARPADALREESTQVDGSSRDAIEAMGERIASLQRELESLRAASGAAPRARPKRKRKPRSK